MTFSNILLYLVHPFLFKRDFIKIIRLISQDRHYPSFIKKHKMSKESTICQRIVSLSEQIICHRKINEKQKKILYLYSRLKSVPPSTIFIKTIIEESERFIAEMESTIHNLMKPLLKGIQFDIDVCRLSSKDIYRGYIELYETKTGKEYILFLKSFNNGLVSIEEGSLKLNDSHQVAKILEVIKPIKKDPEIRTLFEIIMNQK